ncbi:phosphohydrolase (plasmid) [Azospirillum argentinense]|uniref:NUDIX domain-containing protein n=2 Tax=Azospirillum TaxID=191 RepID=A0A2K1G2L1_9PROT|nr:NUDIX hydrolase [Azospirillum argentinense]AIB16273.1 phosphohydrolase [Azospirillum argentinense]EZQ02585.1 phosphohydrolase [Azospirillum argentinense]PNQ99030.1 NUDIX domain-containing protein [Azospirillum argentinense]QCO06665.1 NUDIX domain-containing protein [Azospirillum argentinense]
MSSTPPADRSGREYPDRPWVGVGAVVWRGDRVLLIRRGRPPRMGQWSLPGGAQSVGETVFETAVREVLEETGLHVVPTEVVTVVDAMTLDDAGAVQYHYTIVEVAAESPEGEAVCADDALEARWATIDEAAELTEWDETERVIRLSASRRAGG